MKREGGLFARIADMDNLRLAYWKASRGKQDRPDVRAFALDLQGSLRALREELLDGGIAVGHAHTFTIFDPKRRVICAAVFRERVLHHAIMNVCHDRFERFQVPNSFASRKGKGTYAALEQAAKYSRTSPWFLKLDVRHCFETVDHCVLKASLARLFREPELLDLMYRIIECHETEPGKGLPIGHLTSQYFANHLLARVDHHIQSTLRIRCYVRYMDDMVFWGGNREALCITAEKVRRFLRDALSLSLKPPCLHRMTQGLPFLGYVVFPDHVELSRRSRTRYRRKLRDGWRCLQSGEWSQRGFADHVTPLVAFTRHATGGRGFRQRTLQEIERTRGGLEPREPERELEQLRWELPRGEPEQERAGQPEQQPGLPACSFPRSSGDRRMPSGEQGGFCVREGAPAVAGGSGVTANPAAASF